MCFPTIDDVHWLTNLEGTHWLEHIKVDNVSNVEVVNGQIKLLTSRLTEAKKYNYTR